MKNLSIIRTSLIFFSTANGQTLEYAARFRNFSIESETDSGYLISFNLYQDKHDHKMSAAVNITKDIRIKNVLVISKLEIVVHRCSFEKSDCENFLRWKFADNLRSLVYMKNQMWTPLFHHVTPKLDIFPNIKKNVYQSKDMSMDAKEIVKFYPEIVNCLWQFHVIGNDHGGKKALVSMFEGIIIPFVRRNKTRTRGNTSTAKTEKLGTKW